MSFSLYSSISSLPEEDTLSLHYSSTLPLVAFRDRGDRALLSSSETLWHPNSLPYYNLHHSYDVNKVMEEETEAVGPTCVLLEQLFLRTLTAVNQTIPRRLGKLTSCVHVH
ncbi:hypothetical protein AGDE_16747 [Angomonas deanei]|nr:hypothetical protein AGDE_16747 [Angomonas deanei]|eukprot:EPY16289.1 hypothetical protein AGDE_16747 [Angomonas deanei]